MDTETTPALAKVKEIILDVRRFEKKVKQGEQVTTIFVLAVNNEKVGSQKPCRVTASAFLDFLQRGAYLNLWGREMKKGDKLTIFVHSPMRNSLLPGFDFSEVRRSESSIIKLLSKASVRVTGDPPESIDRGAASQSQREEILQARQG